jgi:hypothetical protein
MGDVVDQSSEELMAAVWLMEDLMMRVNAGWFLGGTLFSLLHCDLVDECSMVPSTNCYIGLL